MPMLHRHIVPNVAGKDDNGKIVFGSNGKPSHRRLIKFSLGDVAWNWPIDDDSYAWFKPSSFANWATSGPTASVLNKMLIGETPQGGSIGPPGSIASNWEGYYSPPLVDYSPVFRYGSSQFRTYDSPPAPGSSYAYGYRIRLDSSVELVWDPNNTWWKWRAELRFRCLRRVWLDGNGSEYDTGGSDDCSTILESAQLVDDIRPGSGGIVLNYVDYPDVATSATLYSAYA